MEYDCKNPALVAADWNENISVKKTTNDPFKLLVLGILAGAYIGFGGELSNMIGHDAAKFVGAGLAAFIKGAVFSTGLMLVVIAGAELFTGNTMITMSVLDGKSKMKGLLYNWSIVYTANLIGSLLLATIMFGSGLLEGANVAVGAAALKTAAGKVSLAFWPAFFRGILCNWLVCLAVWMAMASRNTIGKVWAIFFPIMAFVASGFEHSVANMYFIPIGMLLKGVSEVVAAASAAGLSAESLANVGWYGFLVRNLVPVTLGNIVGGGFFVATLYWFTYIRKGKKV
ncbi:MAG: formate/nitrite transporter family protein [Candidatus Aminicenantes bacterium]|nr:formate/nitrite transporter family protein [Acidobacteriota bacterium]MCG2811295.1 formate/nitrite transporter family protein [Candidatus Aminicenantes bacterium]